jgi:hypothetical protein
MANTDSDANPEIRSLLHALGLRLVLYNRDTLDWNDSFAEISSPRIPNLFKEWVAETPMKGSISLQHDLYSVPVQAIGPSLSTLKSSMYTVTDISECVQVKPFDFKLLVVIGFAKDWELKPPTARPSNGNSSGPALPFAPSGGLSTRISWFQAGLCTILASVLLA